MEILDKYMDLVIYNSDAHNPFAYIVLFLEYWISLIQYRVFIRGKCALFGCEEHYGRSWNMPDDCTEWWCSNCGAEGINAQITTRKLFYKDIPFENFIQAIKGK